MQLAREQLKFILRSRLFVVLLVVLLFVPAIIDDSVIVYARATEFAND